MSPTATLTNLRHRDLRHSPGIGKAYCRVFIGLEQLSSAIGCRVNAIAKTHDLCLICKYDVFIRWQQTCWISLGKSLSLNFQSA